MYINPQHKNSFKQHEETIKQNPSKICLLSSKGMGGNVQCFLNVWLRRKCLQKECKDPKESIKFSTTTMHC